MTIGSWNQWKSLETRKDHPKAVHFRNYGIEQVLVPTLPSNAMVVQWYLKI